MIKKIKQRLLFSLALGGLFYLAFTIYADFDLLVLTFRKFSLWLLPVLLLLSFLNYLFRFAKWHYYLGLLKIKIQWKDSLSIFLSGLIMSVTPGKMGELLKAYLVKEVNGTSVALTGPIILFERITDFVSLLIIALTGAYFFDYGRNIVLGVALFFLIVLIIMSNKRFALPIIKIFENVSFLKKYFLSIHTAYESSYTLVQIRPLLISTFISLISWSFECLGYFLILFNFDLQINFFWASFSYAFATIVGAISMLPGGLGVTEGSLTYLTMKIGASKEIAVASTFIIRVATLWFAVLVGVVSVSFYQKRFGSINFDLQNKNKGNLHGKEV
ncbi:MAG TPA: lysylphosphatidylglycerol synthase transmembrane domain-containing protein [Ignavibacteriaceae bacterium]|nr:lysylphosphatidylglycerol synthase transmembrane domain-containing protein [Ignavibacteriaceae bacterium]